MQFHYNWGLFILQIHYLMFLLKNNNNKIALVILFEFQQCPHIPKFISSCLCCPTFMANFEIDNRSQRQPMNENFHLHNPHPQTPYENHPLHRTWWFLCSRPWPLTKPLSSPSLPMSSMPPDCTATTTSPNREFPIPWTTCGSTCLSLFKEWRQAIKIKSHPISAPVTAQNHELRLRFHQRKLYCF